MTNQVEANEDPDDGWADEMNDRFAEAPDRAAKLAVLKDYMSESMAEDAIGRLMGEHSGDVVIVDDSMTP